MITLFHLWHIEHFHFHFNWKHLDLLLFFSIQPIFVQKFLQYSRLYWWDGNVRIYSNSMRRWCQILSLFNEVQIWMKTIHIPSIQSRKLHDNLEKDTNVAGWLGPSVTVCKLCLPSAACLTHPSLFSFLVFLSFLFFSFFHFYFSQT